MPRCPCGFRAWTALFLGAAIGTVSVKAPRDTRHVHGAGGVLRRGRGGDVRGEPSGRQEAGLGQSVKLEGECGRKAACLALVGGHEHMDEVALRAARIQGVALGRNAYCLFS